MGELCSSAIAKVTSETFDSTIGVLAVFNGLLLSDTDESEIFLGFELTVLLFASIRSESFFFRSKWQLLLERVFD